MDVRPYYEYAATSLMQRSRKTSGGAPRRRYKLSTERSRRCRARQKLQARALEERVYSLRVEVSQMNMELQLSTSRHTRGEWTNLTKSNCIQLVREYFNMLRFGVRPPVGTAPAFRIDLMRIVGVEITRETQCAFLQLFMEPNAQAFGCNGNCSNGVRAILDPWDAWTRCHASTVLDLDTINVIESLDGTVARTSCKMHVRTSAETMRVLFPLAAHHPAIYAKLVNKSICYTMNESFFFGQDGRVTKYTCDIDFVVTLLPILGNIVDVLRVVKDLAPPYLPAEELAVAVSPAEPVPMGPNPDSRFGLDFLLS